MKLNRTILRILFGAIAVCLPALSAFASPKIVADTAHFRLRYVVDVPEIDSTFVDNNQRITDMSEFLSEVRDDSTLTITGVKFRGTASPDGPYERNVWLSENRLRTFKELVRQYIDIPDSIIYANSTDIPWDEFRAAVDASDMSHRDEVLAIIDMEPELVPFWGGRHIDHRLLKLKRLYNGTVWNDLKSPVLRDLRYGDVVFYFNRFMLDPIVRISEAPRLTFMPLEAPSLSLTGKTVETWMPRMYLKTNVAAWALFSANAAFEIDFARHWSFTLPVYYCGMDWFKSTIKFRNFTLQPEVRWWPRSSENEGFFLGAHFMMCYYNVALDGEWRYQDFRGRTPALGGGVALGYRLPISKNKRWHMEFTVGAGIYPLDYSLFHNTPDVKDGQWHARNKKTYIGIDQVGITFAYSWDMPRFKRTFVKKGGTL